jgi:hypothetical protein
MIKTIRFKNNFQLEVKILKNKIGFLKITGRNS